MTLTELFELENKIQHKIDYASLGFVTVKSNNAYITTTSFLSGYTTFPAISRAIGAASDGWTITKEDFAYPEASITVDKSLTFDNNAVGNIVLKNITMNGVGKTLTLAKNYDLDNASVLTLTNGNINTGSNTLTLLNPATGAISGGVANSHVVGNLKRAVSTGVNYDYMVGTGTNLERIKLNITSQSGLTDITTSFTNTAPGTNISPINQYEQMLQTGYWIVTPNVGTTTATYSLRLYPTNFTNYPTGMGGYTVFKRVGAGSWHEDGTHDPADDLNPSGVWTDNSISRSGIVGFSNFGVGASLDVPLPLKLGSFTANRKEKDVHLAWKTFSETDMMETVIERSVDGRFFSPVGRIPSKNGMGDIYSYVDKDPFTASWPILYYRLQFKELSGKTDFSQVRLVRSEYAPKLVELYPNPATNTIILTEVLPQAEIMIMDAVGRTLLTTQWNGSQIEVGSLSSGVYQMVIKAESGSQIIPFLKQ